MYKYILLCCCLLFVTACEDSEATTLRKKEDAKWTAVMANHDVVMPMMSTTNKVRKKLKKALTENENLPSETIERINVLIKDLDKADEGMMDWMNGFQQLEKLQKNKEHKAIITYLDKEDKIIKKVGYTMTDAISNGIAFLEEFDRRQQ